LDSIYEENPEILDEVEKKLKVCFENTNVHTSGHRSMSFFTKKAPKNTNDIIDQEQN
jgi:hypothetical protein